MNTKQFVTGLDKCALDTKTRWHIINTRPVTKFINKTRHATNVIPLKTEVRLLLYVSSMFFKVGHDECPSSMSVRKRTKSGSLRYAYMKSCPIGKDFAHFNPLLAVYAEERKSNEQRSSGGFPAVQWSGVKSRLAQQYLFHWTFA